LGFLNGSFETSDTLVVSIVDQHAPIDHAMDPTKAAEALERTRIPLLGKAVDIEDTRRRVSSALHKFYATQGSAQAGEAHDATAAPLLRVQAGLMHSRHHRPIKARWSTAKATALQAGAVEVTTPSGLAAMADIDGT
jgi:hypothetical protein